MSKILNEKLICDVLLPPATIIKRGCDLRTLLVAINQRGNLPPAQRVLREAALAQQPAQATTEGWKLVPVEPTREMWAAAGDCVTTLQWTGIGHHDKISSAVYRAMLAAAPVAPIQTDHTALLSELYQILGAHGVTDAVLEQVQEIGRAHV